jgi:serine/threonine protein kinase/tetratricopeptide (TPR) repeat protein
MIRHDSMTIQLTGGDAELVRLTDEITGRLETGESFDLDAFIAEHPEHEHELRRLFPAIRALVDLSLKDDRPDAEATPSEVAPDRTLGDFRILREIGRGGMGVVYEAEQISLGRRVALKVLPFAAMLDQQQLARFKNEARAAATLKHPHIVSVYSVGCERGVHYYSMELVEGQSLAQIAEQLRSESGRAVEQQNGRAVEQQRSSGVDESAIRNPQSEIDTSLIAALSTIHAPSSSLPAYSSREYFRTIAQLGIQAAEALDHAHQNGILHRDIKPANLLVDDTGKLWITDFGLATTQTDAGLTMTGDLLGTLRYMSPEQAAGDRAKIDYRTDIYSLGITLYELLACEPAFADADRHILLRRIVDGAFKPPRSFNPAIPRDLETIVLTATATEPTDRYGAMNALADDLCRFLDARPLHAKRHHHLQRISRWLRRHHLATAAAAAVVIVIALIQALALKRETRLRGEANAERARAETNQQLAWDVTFNALEPLTSGWEQLPKSYTLQRQALDELIAAHRANTDPANGANHITLLNFSRLLLLRADNSWQLGYDMKEDCETAISILERLRADQSANNELRELLASAYGDRGKYLHLELRLQECAAACLESAEIDRDYDGAMFALNKSGKPATALEYGRVSLAMLRKTEASLGPRPYVSVTLREKVACSLLQLGRAVEAAALINEAVEVSEQFKPEDYVSQYWQARALMTSASIASQAGDIGRGNDRAKLAVEIFRELHDLAPGLVWISRKLGESYVYLSDCLVAMNQLDEAEKALRDALRLYQSVGGKHDQFDAARVEFRLAQVLAASGRTLEASQAARSSLQVFEEFGRALPYEPDCISKLVILLTMSPDPSLRDAVRAADLATRTLPDSCGQYWRLRALAQYRAGLWENAIESAGKAMAQLEGGDCIDRFILAMACWQNDNRHDAQHWFEQAIDRIELGMPTQYHDMGPLAVHQLREEAETMILANETD